MLSIRITYVHLCAVNYVEERKGLLLLWLTKHRGVVTSSDDEASLCHRVAERLAVPVLFMFKRGHL